MNNKPVALTQVEIMNALTLGVPLYTHPVKEKDRFPKNFWEDTSATLENIQRADYIFTHYAKSDIIALARDLDRRDAKIAHPVKELTDEEIEQVMVDSGYGEVHKFVNPFDFARAILRKAQEK